MRIHIVIIFTIIAFNSFAQEKKLKLEVYINDAICWSPIQHRVFKDGKATLTNLTKSGGSFFGCGAELLKNLDKNWWMGADLGFISKGYFAVKDSTYSNGSVTGTGFQRID